MARLKNPALRKPLTNTPTRQQQQSLFGSSSPLVLHPPSSPSRSIDYDSDNSATSLISGENRRMHQNTSTSGSQLNNTPSSLISSANVDVKREKKTFVKKNFFKTRKHASYQKKGRMPDPPATKRKGSFTITMPIDKKLEGGQELISPAYSFDGLNWRVHVTLKARGRRMLFSFLHCEGDGSCELWRTRARITTRREWPFAPRISERIEEKRVDTVKDVSHTFHSWTATSNKCQLTSMLTPLKDPVAIISVTVETECESFTHRPIFDPKWSIHDVILVLEGQKIHVNKQELSVQSSYFDKLFNRDFKESKQKEIEIKDTDPEDFRELLQLLRGLSTEPTTVENAVRYLAMADKFDFQIVKDRMENFLLSTDLITIHRKFLIAEQYNLGVLKESGLLLYKSQENLEDLTRSAEYAEFPAQLVKDLLFHHSK